MKKRAIIVSAVLLLVILFTGCNGVSQADYDETVAAYQAAQATIESITEENNNLQTENSRLQAEYDVLEAKYDKTLSDFAALSSEYDAYKAKMSPYEELQQAEAEVRQQEAEAALEAARLEAEAQAAAEAAEREARERQGYETGITYDQLARTPDEYEGELIKFYGEVIQVIDDPDEITIRLAVNGDYDQVILCGYEPSIVSSRVLEDDYITIYGMSVGLISYESTFGGMITIPAVWVDKIDQ